jgi:hypothetical protein
MIVQIEDSQRKINVLKSAGLTPNKIIESRDTLREFLEGAEARELGIAVVDMGVFDGLTQQEMLEHGHALAESGWRVIFWSTLAKASLIGAECWFDDQDNYSAAERIAKAIASDFEDCDLKRGEVPANYELTLRTLSSLLPFGLLWETKNKDAALALPTGNDYEALLIARLSEHIKWSSSAFTNYVNKMDRLLADKAEETKVVGIWRTVGIEPPPGDLDSALRQLALSDSPRQWNQRLTALRRTLLDQE